MEKSPDYKTLSIEIPTVFGESKDQDKFFTDYLEEYSIVWKILEESSSEGEWPIVQYMGGPISLTNMLQEKFGFSMQEIRSEFPHLLEGGN